MRFHRYNRELIHRANTSRPKREETESESEISDAASDDLEGAITVRAASPVWGAREFLTQILRDHTH